MTRALAGLAVLALCLVPAAAHAWPVDVKIELQAGPGNEKFHRLSSIAWVEVEDPKIATVEILESGELLLTGVKPGRTWVLLYADGKFAVWSIRVAGAKDVDPAPLIAAAKQACPGLKATPASTSAEGVLEGPVKDERCRKALLELLKTDAFTAKELELTFEIPALQAQLASIEEGLAQAVADPAHKLSARYLGAGLVLKGTVTAAEHRKALWQVFRRTVGRTAMDDQLAIGEPPGADGGVGK